MDDKLKIIIIDDEESIIKIIKKFFPESYNITTFTDPIEALMELKNTYYDIAIVDYKMPKVSGIDILTAAKKNKSYAYGILITGYADTEMLENALNKNLVNKVINKPFHLNTLKAVIDEAIAKCKEKKESKIEKLKLKNIIDELNFLNNYQVIGFNKDLKGVFEKVQSISQMSVNVLLTGETGTGKEVIAHSIHNSGQRKDGPFIKINCAAIPNTLFESELFGYEKGAFTEAKISKPGKVELANEGTLFLDEIGEMELPLQAKMLRVLEEKEVTRLGSNKMRKIDFRLITATNKDLQVAVMEKKFREDLYYRISEYPIHLPALRERKNDIEDLIFHFIDKFSKEMNIKKPNIDPTVISGLKKYPWPGNVREFENAVKRAVIRSRGENIIKINHFDFIFYNPLLKNDDQFTRENLIDALTNEIFKNKLSLKDLENELLKNILKNTNNNVAKAVEKTGITRDKFYRFKKTE